MFQAADAALRFWMGSNPIFLPPGEHEDYGLLDLTMPPITQIVNHLDLGPESEGPRYRTETIVVPRHLDTDEEDEQ